MRSWIGSSLSETLSPIYMFYIYIKNMVKSNLGRIASRGKSSIKWRLTLEERLSAPRRMPPLYFKEIIVVPSLWTPMMSSLSACMPPSWTLRVWNCYPVFIIFTLIFTNFNFNLKCFWKLIRQIKAKIFNHFNGSLPCSGSSSLNVGKRWNRHHQRMLC